MVATTGKVLRILPFKEVNVEDTTKKVVDLIIADELDYQRISFWDDKAEMVRCGKIKVGDVLRIDNASVPETHAGSEKRAHAGTYAKISKVAVDIEPLRQANAMKVTVLAVARPEKGQVCIAGIDENGEWIRPQGVYAADMDTAGMPLFKNFCVSTLYADAWRGRSLGLIKPRIVQVYEEKVQKGTGEKSYERYIRFNFKDVSGRVYRRWSCRCNAFYNAWNAMKQEHRWTYGWRMLKYLRRNETYLTIGLTHSDYGVSGLEYGAYPLVVGVHVVQNRK